MTRTVGVLLISLALWSTQLQQGRPVFRSGVRYVVLDAVVTDERDVPVPGLAAADFEIRENGRLQRIADMEYVRVPPHSRSIDLMVAGPVRDVVSNAPPTVTARAIVFVLDLLDPQDIVPIKRVMTAFLQQLSPEDEAAIVYTGRSDLGQDFTRDPVRLIRSVNNLNASFGAALPRDTFFTVMENVLASLWGAPHARRAVVYISNGHAVNFGAGPSASNWKNTGPDQVRFQELFDRARQAGAPIYTLDPRGLLTPESASNIGRIRTPEARKAVERRLQLQSNFNLIVAENTGARGFVNQSDVVGAVGQIMTELGSYYLLGYYPDPWVADGRFHPVEVRVRRPGVRVRARAGYTTERVLPPQVARKPRLIDRLREGLPGGDLPLRAFVAPLIPTRAGARAVLTLDVSYPAVTSASSRPDDRLQLAWVAIDTEARIRASGSQTARVPLGSAGLDAFTLSLNHVVDLPRDAHIVRVLVSSEALEAAGRVHVPIDMRPLREGDLRAAPLVLAVAGGRQVLVADLASPRRLIPFQPTTQRVFSAGQRLGIFTRVFPGDVSEVATELLLKRGGAIVQSIPLQVLPAADVSDALDCQAMILLQGLDPGEYYLEFTASRRPSESVQRALPFRIQ